MQAKKKISLPKSFFLRKKIIYSLIWFIKKKKFLQFFFEIFSEFIKNESN